MSVQTFLTARQAADLLGVSTRTLERWRVDGSGPTYHRVGARVLRYSTTDVLAWMAERQHASRAAELAA